MSPAPIEAIAAYINPAYPIVGLCVSSMLSMIIPCTLVAEYGDNRYLFGGNNDNSWALSALSAGLLGE